MDSFFYIAVLLCITIEFIKIGDMREVVKIVKQYRQDKQKSDEFQFLAWTDLFYMATCMIGLVTFQWYLFVSILILSLIPKRGFIWAYYIDSILCLTILLFALLNKYHFHLNLF